MSNTAQFLVEHQTMRGNDPFGSGKYGASRDGGSRSHNGIDFEAKFGDEIRSPISGSIKRMKYPYKDDLSFEGCEISGSGEWQGIEITLFYVKMSLKPGESVSPGSVIGTSQNLTKRYPGITNHVHIEIKKNGVLVDPNILWKVSE